MTLPRALLLLIIGSTVAASLLTPPLYAGLLKLDPELRWPYSRVFDRVILLTTIVGIWILRRHLPLAKARQALQTHPWRIRLSLLVQGCLLAALTSAAALLYLTQAGPVMWNNASTAHLVEKALTRAIPTAIVVSLLEEVLFRGVLFQALRERWSFWSAAAIGSLGYSIVHFITPDKAYVFPGGSLTVGFEYLAHILARIFTTEVLPAIACLWVVGIILCGALERSRSLALSIGLHAGWILVMKMAVFSTARRPNVEFGPLLGQRYFMLAEPAVWLSMAVVCMAVVFLTRRYQKRFESAPRELARSGTTMD